MTSRLVHKFYLVRRTEHEFADYARLMNTPGATELHDDLVGYLWDTLRWIPTLDPTGNEPCQGLNRWGPTVIACEGAPQARAIFGSWAEIFSCGPAQLQLQGPWTWTGGATSESGHYEQMQLQRDDVVRALRRLESYAAEVSGAKGNLYMLHLGI